ncbi:MAG: DUF885 domain-containing protein [Acidobacteria bacterium]|nr:DUF885 domain-containing protein [Acidobacteriota bacterium]
MRAAILFATLVLAGCQIYRKPLKLVEHCEEFVYTTLSFTPTYAAANGHHHHAGVPMDELLDDYAPQAINRQRTFYKAFRKGLEKLIDRGRLTPGDKADYDIIQNQIDLALLELDRIQSFRHNPTLYAESLGNALFHPVTVEYTNQNVRWFHIIRRLEKVPPFFEIAKMNLVDSPPLWIEVARQENEGNIALVEGEIRARTPADLKDSFERAAGPALAAMRGFNRWLTEELSKRPSDWRLAKDLYEEKFRRTLVTSTTPAALLAEAEAEIERIRTEMFRLAGGRPGQDAGKVIRAELDRVARRHATPETLFSDAARDLEEARAFIRREGLLGLPARDNLKVIETPEHMRGVYAVGGFNPAPPLEPKLGAFYWLTPVPKDWTAERIESKFREDNFYGLKILTIHEAMPGHYVQFEYSNDIQPPARRLLRTVYGNGPYIEGWAVYATAMMIENGYLEKDPGLKLMWLKHLLRVAANTVLDIRLHTMNMSDEEAMSLMMERTFQERHEAEAKLRRAKLTSVQLPTYFAGYREMLRLRDQVKQARGGAFTLRGFHDDLLRLGAVPVPVAGGLLTAPPPPAAAPSK